MDPSVETRLSLIVRLKSRADEAAWQEFVEIYRPVIVRLATRRGMQHADAEDLSQQVLVSVTKAIGRWEIAPRRTVSRLAPSRGTKRHPQRTLAYRTGSGSRGRA